MAGLRLNGHTDFTFSVSRFNCRLRYKMSDSSDPTLRVSMLPRDTNGGVSISGVVILSHRDVAGGIAASRVAARNFVTRAMRGVEFIAPVYVGDVVSFYTSIVRRGTTSITVKVSVEAERARDPRQRVKVTEAEVVYVSVDEAGKPLSL